MNFAVYSLTRDRLEYTKQAFSSLHEKAGCLFRHYVVDNGSTDGTIEWLETEYSQACRQANIPFHLNPQGRNRGISWGSNLALAQIFSFTSPDVVVKMDNDCVIKSPRLFLEMERVFEELGPESRYVLSPRVEGINRQPHRGCVERIAGHEVGLTAIVGGLCHFVPADLYLSYIYPEALPFASGQDDHLCNWVKRDMGGQVGYVEDLVVEHVEGTDAQAKRYPEYFARKWREEKEVPTDRPESGPGSVPRS